MRARPTRLLLVLPLAACSNSASLTLASSGALDAQQVQLAVTEVRFQDDGGEVVTVDSGDTQVHNLRDFANGSVINLLSGAALARGHYTGVALMFASDSARVVNSAGQTFPISVPGDPVFGATDFTVLRRDDASLWAGLDLRLSLSDRSASSGDWQLVPRLNIASLDTDGSLAGSIDAAIGSSDACLQGRSAPDGAAVYAWPGAGVTPHDESPAAMPARATALVTWSAADGTGRYSFPHLTAGTYTIALDCTSSQDDPQSDQGQVFAASGQATVSEGDSATLDLRAAN